MGLCSHNGLLVMLLFHLCQAQEDALPSPDPEPAPPSLGEVIDAVKAAFEQAVQISTNGAVREALEQVVEELTPEKNLADQSPVVEDTANRTTEEAADEEAVVLNSEEPAVHISESSEQTHNEQSPEGLTQDAEPAEVIQGLRAHEESSISEPEQKSDIKPEGLVLEAIDSVQEALESVLQDSEIAEVGEPVIEDSNSEESPVQMYTDTQSESKRGAAEMHTRGKDVEEAGGKRFTEEETHLEERTANRKTEEVEVTIGSGGKIKEPQDEESVEMQEGTIESELGEEERQAVTAQMGADGVVLDMDEVEQEEEEQEAAETEEGVIEVEANREDGAEAKLQKVSKEEVPPTDEIEPEKTQQEPGKRHEASDVNEIITSNPDMNVQDEPVLNTVEDLPPTAVLRLGLGDTGAPEEEQADSTQTKVVGQEAWKIGAISAAFLLLLQTAVTILYILKCRRKPDSSLRKNLCDGGNGECDANNTDTTIPIDEQSTVDDLPEYSQVQQEDVAMTTIPLDSTEQNPSCDPRTSAV